MAKNISKIAREMALRLGYRENDDSTFTHPYKIILENLKLDQINRNIRLAGRLRR
jgi:hypothetical protein